MAKKKTNQKRKSKTPSDHVVMIEDPFQLSNLEISDAQHLDGEVPLDEPEIENAENHEDLQLIEGEEAEEQLEKIASAMNDEAEKLEKELEETVEASQALEDAENDLAEQIAEDLALEEELKKQAEEEDQTPILAANEEGDIDLQELESCIETLLFLSDKPLAPKKIKELLGPDHELKLFKKAIKSITRRYQEAHHGFELVEVSGGLQFRTKASRAAVARKLGKVQTHKLSRGAMETLSVIAYRQPVMKEDIDKIRGVDSSHFVRGLLEKRLITIRGRSELPGRPILYGTSAEFLEIFGLKDLDALPPLKELEQMIPTSETEDQENEDPNVRKMRELVHQMAEDKERLDYNPKEDEQFLQDIRERVKSIATSTPFLDEQKEAEKEAKKKKSEDESSDGQQSELRSEAESSEELSADALAEAMVDASQNEEESPSTEVSG